MKSLDNGVVTPKQRTVGQDTWISAKRVDGCDVLRLLWQPIAIDTFKILYIAFPHTAAGLRVPSYYVATTPI